ncbi:hypothetical protein [Pseudomonas sp. CGJS7]|uniref:hypothetical protein n=1 Tax=Pseudomonas sp. CGJS7 TaxID=3109348 RepID=UPI0030092E50
MIGVVTLLAVLTLPVLLYQLLFVAIMYVASRIGPKTMIVALVGSLAWTATHLFFPPLAVLQSVVIVVSYVWFRRKRTSHRSSARAQLPTPQNGRPERPPIEHERE